MAACLAVKVKASASSSDRGASVRAKHQVMVILGLSLICVYSASAETPHQLCVDSEPTATLSPPGGGLQ